MRKGILGQIKDSEKKKIMKKGTSQVYKKIWDFDSVRQRKTESEGAEENPRLGRKSEEE